MYVFKVWSPNSIVFEFWIWMFNCVINQIWKTQEGNLPSPLFTKKTRIFVDAFLRWAIFLDHVIKNQENPIHKYPPRL